MGRRWRRKIPRAIIRRLSTINWRLRPIIRRLGAISWRLRGSIIGIVGSLFVGCASELAAAACDQTNSEHDQQDCPPFHIGALSFDRSKKSWRLDFFFSRRRKSWRLGFSFNRRKK